MKAFKITLHCILTIFIIIVAGCSSKDQELSAIEIQESIDEQIAIAKEYLSNGKNSQAITLLEDLQKQYPNMINTIEALAFAYTDIGDSRLAAFYFEQIIKKAPTLCEYRIFAAQAYMDAKDYTEACRNYKNYLDFFPNDRTTWKALAKAYELDKKDQLALEGYLKAEELTLSPSTEQDALKIARLHNKAKNAREAKTWYHLVLAHNPESIEAYTRLLKLEIQSGNWTEAQKHLTKLQSFPAKKVDPAFISLAKDVLLKKPKFVDTKQSATATKAQSIKEKLQDHLHEAKEFRANGDFASAIESYKKALSINSKRASIWHEMSLSYSENNDIENAALAAEEAIDREPENIAYTFNYLKILKAISSDQKLLEELIRAKEKFPNSPEITLSLAQVHHKIDGNLHNAKSLYEEFLQQAPNHTKSKQILKILSSL